MGQQGASAARRRWLSTPSSRGTRPPKGKRTARPKQERTPRAPPPRKHTATQKNRALNNGAWGALPPHPLQWGRTYLEQYEQIEPTRHEDKEQCDQQKRVRLYIEQQHQVPHPARIYYAQRCEQGRVICAAPSLLPGCCPPSPASQSPCDSWRSALTIPQN